MNNKFFLYFGLGMAALYCISGILIILYGENIFELPDWARVGTGCLLILYGLFRFQRHRNLARQNENQ